MARELKDKRHGSRQVTTPVEGGETMLLIQNRCNNLSNVLHYIVLQKKQLKYINYEH